MPARTVLYFWNLKFEFRHLLLTLIPNSKTRISLSIRILGLKLFTSNALMNISVRGNFAHRSSFHRILLLIKILFYGIFVFKPFTI